MNDVGALGLRWLRLGLPPELEGARPERPRFSSRVACPHCTNVDTLTDHCRSTGCEWVSCTCGALVYTARRHRHPRHGSARDTCHDPSAAV